MSQKNDESSESAPLLPSSQDKAPPPQAMPPEAAAAFMAQYGTANPAAAYMAGYYADPAAAAAAAAVFAQQAPGGPHFYPGLPPPSAQGYPPGAPPPGQAFFPIPSFMYPPQPFPNSPVQRPPRSQRRSGGRVSPLMNPTRRSFSDAYASPGVPQSVVPPLATQYDDRSGQRDRSTIPDIQEIFSDEQPLLQSTTSAQDETGYGSTASRTPTGQSPASSPKIYNAPSRSSSRSGGKSKLGPTLVRTSSIGDLKQHPLKSGGSFKAANHRRTSSDVPLRPLRKRLGSGDERPPMGHRRGISSNGSGSMVSRGRSFSAGQLKKPTHRRGDSLSSLMSTASVGSVVSNIAKSEFFGGIDEQGRVQMHFPFESIRLVMVDPERPVLRLGHLYLDGHISDFDQFEEYHRAGDGFSNDTAPQWESLDRHDKKLPRPSYMLAVKDDVYQHVLGEISDAQTMPCGLFFCGHHEDVAHPSIMIAVFLVFLVFACLLYAAFCTGDIVV